MGLAAAEVGLKFDYRIPTYPGKPLGRAHQKGAEAVCEVGAAEEFSWVAIFRRRVAGMDLAQIGGKLGLKELAGRNVLVRLDDFAPG